MKNPFNWIALWLEAVKSRTSTAAGLEDMLPAVVTFALIAIVAAVSALILQNFASNPLVPITITTASVNSVNAITFNSFSTNAIQSNIIISCSDNCNWVTAANPLTVSLSGNYVTTNAAIGSNAVSIGSGTQSVTFTSNPTGTVTSFVGNFYNITTVAVTGVAPGQSGEVLTITQKYGATPRGVGGYVTNSIVATGTVTSSGSVAYNAINYGNTSIGTLTSFLSLIALVLVAAIIIGIVLLAFAFRGGNAGGHTTF